MSKWSFGAVLLAWALFGVLPAHASDDPSIRGELRTNIQRAMKGFVEANTVEGAFRLYDPVEGKLLRLTFEKLHDGIVKKGDFYVSCADFADQSGRKLDLDFLVMPSGEALVATQAIVHSADGKKRAYHLEE